MQNEPLEITLKVTAFFENLNIPSLIGGSLASTLYGMVRTTQDSDVVAEIRLEHLPAPATRFSPRPHWRTRCLTCYRRRFGATRPPPSSTRAASPASFCARLPNGWTRDWKARLTTVRNALTTL